MLTRRAKKVGKREANVEELTVFPVVKRDSNLILYFSFWFFFSEISHKDKLDSSISVQMTQEVNKVWLSYKLILLFILFIYPPDLLKKIKPTQFI